MTAYATFYHFRPKLSLSLSRCCILADCYFLDRAENVIITGATGVGKSYIATAIGHQDYLKGKNIHNWSGRKTKLFKNEYIQIAYDHLDTFYSNSHELF